MDMFRCNLLSHREQESQAQGKERSMPRLEAIKKLGIKKNLIYDFSQENETLQTSPE